MRVETLDGGALPLIEPLPLRDSFDDVDEDDFSGKLFFGQTLCTGRAHVTRARYRNFIRAHVILHGVLKCYWRVGFARVPETYYWSF